MTNDKRAKRKLERQGDHDVITGRNFSGEERSADDRARADSREPDESDEFVTDAEMEAREANSSPQDKSDD